MLSTWAGVWYIFMYISVKGLGARIRYTGALFVILKDIVQILHDLVTRFCSSVIAVLVDQDTIFDLHFSHFGTHLLLLARFLQDPF